MYLIASINSHTIHIALLSLGVGCMFIGLVKVLYDTMSGSKLLFASSVKAAKYVSVSKDGLSRWVDSAEKRMKKNNFNVKGKTYLLVSLVVSSVFAVITHNAFNNHLVTVLSTLIFFIVPEYFMSILEERHRKRVEDQLASAIKVYSSEAIQGKPLQKIMGTMGNKISDPVGRYFVSCYHDLISGMDSDTALQILSTKFDTHFGKMFVQLIYQSQRDASVIDLFPDLVAKLEDHIELGRNNDTNLSAERVQAFVLSLVPIPAYFLMRALVPSTEYFVQHTLVGRILIMFSFSLLFIFLILDRFMRRVD